MIINLLFGVEGKLSILENKNFKVNFACCDFKFNQIFYHLPFQTSIMYNIIWKNVNAFTNFCLDNFSTKPLKNTCTLTFPLEYISGALYLAD
jgi:hypothetical protein